MYRLVRIYKPSRRYSFKSHLHTALEHLLGSRAATRKKLLEAATSVVAREGAANLTIDGIAAESGMSKGGVLYHFPSKREILEGMLEKLLEESRSREEEFRQTGLSSLEAMIEAERAQSASQRATSLALLAASAEDPSLLEPALPAIKERFDMAAQEAKDPELALILLLANEGMRFMSMLNLLPLSPRKRKSLESRLHLLAKEA